MSPTIPVTPLGKKTYLECSFQVFVDPIEELNVDLLQVVNRTELVQLVMHLNILRFDGRAFRAVW